MGDGEAPEAEKAADREEKQDEEEEADEPEGQAPKAELTEEEKKMRFRPSEIKDLTTLAISATFAKFTLPSSDEGFDEVRYEWSKTGTECQKYLKQWVLSRKLTSRVEELAPSQWFQQKWTEWQKVAAQWKSKQSEYKSLLSKKAADREKAKNLRAARAAA